MSREAIQEFFLSVPFEGVSGHVLTKFLEDKGFELSPPDVTVVLKEISCSSTCQTSVISAIVCLLEIVEDSSEDSAWKRQMITSLLFELIVTFKEEAHLESSEQRVPCDTQCLLIAAVLQRFPSLTSICGLDFFSLLNSSSSTKAEKAINLVLAISNVYTHDLVKQELVRKYVSQNTSSDIACHLLFRRVKPRQQAMIYDILDTIHNLLRRWESPQQANQKNSQTNFNGKIAICLINLSNRKEVTAHIKETIITHVIEIIDDLDKYCSNNLQALLRFLEISLHSNFPSILFSRNNTPYTGLLARTLKLFNASCFELSKHATIAEWQSLSDQRIVAKTLLTRVIRAVSQQRPQNSKTLTKEFMELILSISEMNLILLHADSNCDQNPSNKYSTVTVTAESLFANERLFLDVEIQLNQFINKPQHHRYIEQLLSYVTAEISNQSADTNRIAGCYEILSVLSKLSAERVRTFLGKVMKSLPHHFRDDNLSCYVMLFLMQISDIAINYITQYHPIFLPIAIELLDASGIEKKALRGDEYNVKDVMLAALFTKVLLPINYEDDFAIYEFIPIIYDRYLQFYESPYFSTFNQAFKDAVMSIVNCILGKNQVEHYITPYVDRTKLAVLNRFQEDQANQNNVVHLKCIGRLTKIVLNGKESHNTDHQQFIDFIKNLLLQYANSIANGELTNLMQKRMHIYQFLYHVPFQKILSKNKEKDSDQFVEEIFLKMYSTIIADCTVKTDIQYVRDNQVNALGIAPNNGEELEEEFEDVESQQSGEEENEDNPQALEEVEPISDQSIDEEDIEEEDEEESEQQDIDELKALLKKKKNQGKQDNDWESEDDDSSNKGEEVVKSIRQPTEVASTSDARNLRLLISALKDHQIPLLPANITPLTNLEVAALKNASIAIEEEVLTSKLPLEDSSLTAPENKQNELSTQNEFIKDMIEEEENIIVDGETNQFETESSHSDSIHESDIAELLASHSQEYSSSSEDLEEGSQLSEFDSEIDGSSDDSSEESIVEYCSQSRQDELELKCNALFLLSEFMEITPTLIVDYKKFEIMDMLISVMNNQKEDQQVVMFAYQTMCSMITTILKYFEILAGENNPVEGNLQTEMFFEIEGVLYNLTSQLQKIMQNFDEIHNEEVLAKFAYLLHSVTKQVKIRFFREIFKTIIVSFNYTSDYLSVGCFEKQMEGLQHIYKASPHRLKEIQFSEVITSLLTKTNQMAQKKQLSVMNARQVLVGYCSHLIKYDPIALVPLVHKDFMKEISSKDLLKDEILMRNSLYYINVITRYAFDLIPKSDFQQALEVLKRLSQMKKIEEYEERGTVENLYAAYALLSSKMYDPNNRNKNYLAPFSTLLSIIPFEEDFAEMKRVVTVLQFLLEKNFTKLIEQNLYNIVKSLTLIINEPNRYKMKEKERIIYSEVFINLKAIFPQSLDIAHALVIDDTMNTFKDKEQIIRRLSLDKVQSLAL